MINLLLILSTALIGRKLCQRIRQPIILGELLAGIALAGIGVAQLTEPVQFIADLGILILLFSTGLAVDFDELKRLGRPSAIIAFTGAFFPFALGYAFAIFSGFSFLQAFFIGSVLVATSIGVSAAILSEAGMLKTRLGTLIMGSAVFDDIIGVLVLGFLTGLVGGAIIWEETILLVVLTALFFSLSLFFVTKIMARISRFVVFKAENLILLGLVITLIYALVAKQIGLELVIGAFLGGLVLGQSRYSRDLLENISVFGESFFIPVFFVTVGMQFDPSAFGTLGFISALLIIIAIAGKIIGCFLGSIISRFDSKEALVIGIAMIPRAEIAIVITGIGLATNIIDKSIASSILAMVLVTTLITPPLLAKALKRLKKSSKNNFN